MLCICGRYILQEEFLWENLDLPFVWMKLLNMSSHFPNPFLLLNKRYIYHKLIVKYPRVSTTIHLFNLLPWVNSGKVQIYLAPAVSFRVKLLQSRTKMTQINIYFWTFHFLFPLERYAQQMTMSRTSQKKWKLSVWFVCKSHSYKTFLIYVWNSSYFIR